MTVIRPNSISGVTSITAQGGNINVFRADGTAGDLTINNIVGAAATFTGVLTYEDVTNVDSVGIITARQGIKVTADGTSSSNYISAGASDDLKLYHTSGGNSHIKETGGGSLVINADDFYLQNNATTTFLRTHSSGAIDLNFGGNKKFETTNSGTIVTGVCTATSFSGSGANLTNLPAQATIANNADNRVITGGSGVNLNGEANLTFETSTSGGTLTVAGTSEYQIKLKDSNTSGNGAETALAFTDSGNTVQGFVGYNYWGDGNIDLQNNNTGGSVCINTGGGNERLVVTSDGDIYGPSGGRKNWFDNGSFDCTYGGRKANTSMDYGNHHAYGWVTDRFMSRNSVQWSRSTNVPTGKGFSYSTQTNGAAGQIMQAVELPDYGDMGVFTPGSYWCVSIWSTASMSNSAAAFSYDLGSTKTDLSIVHPSGSNAYQTTGETASGTSTGTFSRYYMVFQMPSSIISGATGIYFTWGFSAAGYATGWQLERVPTSTSKPTPYEHVHPSVTIARCRRYAYRKYNSRHVCGWKRHDSNVNWEARHPVLPTHMPSGPNQSADPYGVIMHTAGTLTNFQSVWQNPAVTSLNRYGFNPADGSFILYGTSGYSGTHVVIPSYEGFEYEIQHGFF